MNGSEQGSVRQVSGWDPRSVDAALQAVVGVTGHRNPRPSELPRLRREFEAVLEQVRRLAPDTAITLLSPLAAGCDQHAAEWALAWGESVLLRGRSRVRLAVPRPLPREDYLQDFTRPEERHRYLELESRAWLAFDLPQGRPDAERPLDHDPVTGRIVDRDGRQDRAEHYRRLGRFVAHQSHLMVAFWDGVPPARVGGTAEIVQFCRTGGSLRERQGGAFRSAPYRERCPLLSAGDPTPVWIIATPREGGTEESVQPSTPLAPDELGVLPELDRLGRAMHGRAAGDTQARASTFRSSVLSENPRFAEACALFECLDHVAGEAKDTFVAITKIYICALVLAVAGFQCFSSYADKMHGKVGLLVYVVLLTAAWFLRRRIRSDRVEWIFVHARSMAEILRIQLAMALAGVREEVTGWGLAHRDLDMRPLRRMMRGSLLGLLAVERDPESVGTGRGRSAVDADAIASARERWLCDQRRYLTDATLPTGKRALAARRIRRWQPRMHTAVFLLAVSMLLGVAARWALDWQEASTAFDLGCMVVGVSLALAAGLGMWKEASMDDEDLDQFRRMHAVFSTALDRWPADHETLAGRRQARDLLRAAAKEQFDEACAWHVRHRDRLPEVASG